MIHVKFHTPGEATWFSTSADAVLRFADGHLWRDGEPQRLANYRGNRWVLGGESFEDIAVNERVLVHFESGTGSRSADYGPFALFETRDGMACAGKQLFATYSKEENAWVHQDSGNRWQAMVLRHAMARTAEVR